jgi:hypothetical protein
MITTILAGFGITAAIALFMSSSGFAPLGLVAFVLILKYSRPWQDGDDRN